MLRPCAWNSNTDKTRRWAAGVRGALSGNQFFKHEVSAEGWLQGQNACCRPADVLVMPYGALRVSDDQAGVIYRISDRH